MSYEHDWEVHLALNDPSDPIHKIIDEQLEREEAVAKANKAASDHRKRAKALKKEGLSNPAIARVLGISGTVGLSAEKKVDNLLNAKD